MADTIFAVSSGSLPAAIAVVRISGPGASLALIGVTGALPPPRRAVVRQVRDPDSGVLLDAALVLWFPGPGSATGEDMAELHLHGGRAVVAAVTATLAKVDGLRAAQAGEFTRRALENGRLDLAEAEGLADLLAAETEGQRRHAITLASGHFSQRIMDWQVRLLALSAQIEAALDFSDEDDVPVDARAEFALQAAALSAEIQHIASQPAAERLKDGIALVIAGPPNAGKSTLFNALVQREAAITSSIAGTTRDVIEAHMAIGGIAFRVFDTAGLRESGDETAEVISPVEVIGIARAGDALAVADIVLWLGDASDAPDHPVLIRVAAQADRPHDDDAAWTAQVGRCDVLISAVRGDGMADLHDRIQEHAKALLPAEGASAINARHRAHLVTAIAALSDDGAAGSSDPILIAERLRQARAALDHITGRAGTEDMLDVLFGRFCIGK